MPTHPSKREEPEKVDMLFTPFSDEDFLIGNGGANYLNEVLWRLIENHNELESRINKLYPQNCSHFNSKEFKGKTYCPDCKLNMPPETPPYILPQESIVNPDNVNCKQEPHIEEEELFDDWINYVNKEGIDLIEYNEGEPYRVAPLEIHQYWINKIRSLLADQKKRVISELIPEDRKGIQQPILCPDGIAGCAVNHYEIRLTGEDKAWNSCRDWIINKSEEI